MMLRLLAWLALTPASLLVSSRCHFSPQKKATVCRHADGTVWVGGRHDGEQAAVEHTHSREGALTNKKLAAATVTNNTGPRFQSTAAGPTFFIYEGEAFQYENLINCYRDRAKHNPWSDERRWELAQNTGAI